MPIQSNRILLIYPVSFNTAYPELPIPLLYLSWALEKRGYDIEIFDARLRNISEIKTVDYLFAGITSLTGKMIQEGIKVAKHIRHLNKNIPIVWGGIHVGLLPEQSLKNQYVDIVVRGEGEITIQELADALKYGKELTNIKGISYKNGGQIISNPDREYMDLNDIDIELPYELFEMDKYYTDVFQIHTSRGCPYRCSFCYNIAFNKRKYRTKSANRVVDEIEYSVKKFGVKKINFVEDEFFIDVKRAKEICQGIINRGIKIEWSSFCRFDIFKHIDDEMLRIIEDSGCTLLSFGGESGSQRILDDVIKKDIKVEDIIEATKRLSKTKIQQVVSFMSCLPTETYEDLKKTFNLQNKLFMENPNIFFNGLFLYTPYPGTPLYNIVTTQYKYNAPESLEKWSDFGIYRNVGTTWHDEKYTRLCKVLSILTRFPFWDDKFRFKDISKLPLSKKFKRFPYNLIYFTFLKLATYRWKLKFFIFPIEWLLLEKYLERERGYV